MEPGEDAAAADVGGPAWRRHRADELVAFARRARVDSGFAWLDTTGRPVLGRGLQIWINSRMTYVFALSRLAGRLGDRALAEHGVETLLTRFWDPVHGGWFHTLGPDGSVVDDTKSCYDHAFVLLAACTAQAAGVTGAAQLAERALDVHERRFWEESSGRCREAWDRAWTEPEPYRGANSNMHTVEAYLVAADTTEDERWRRRALAVTEHLIHREARRSGWRVPEHYDEQWRPLPDHHAERPDDQFRPFGATPGHAFEWARLALQLEASLDDPPGWLAEAAVALFQRAADDTDAGRTGFCYTTDWHGRPVVTTRLHWVLAEAILAAHALEVRTGDPAYTALLESWWTLAAQYHLDHEHGSWHHELDDGLRPAHRIWDGKPDAYHAFNALLLTGLPLAPSAALTAGPGSPDGG